MVLAEGVPNTIRSIKKRICRSALIAILIEKDLQTANRSHAELTARLAEMKKPLKIMQMIVQETPEPRSPVGLDLHQIR
jgi:hypothetical protein